MSPRCSLVDAMAAYAIGVGRRMLAALVGVRGGLFSRVGAGWRQTFQYFHCYRGAVGSCLKCSYDTMIIVVLLSKV